MEILEVEMDDYKRGVSVGLTQKSIKDLDKLCLLLDKSSRSEICREIIEGHLLQKKVREMLVSS